MSRLIYLFTIFTVLLWSCTHESSEIIEAGSGDNNGGDTPGDTTQVDGCDPDTVYFKNEILPLLQSSCGTTGCHDAASATEGVILTDYASIIETGDVEPFEPDNSEIYEKIVEAEAEDRMPPPPNNPLKQEQINMIATWINQGALNNSCERVCDTTDVSYAAAVAPVFENFCLGCHDQATANGGVVLETYDQRSTLANSGTVHGVINGTNGYPLMPPSNGLPDCEIAILEKWISDGAPNN